MNISYLHSHGAEAPIKIPAIGLDLFVRLPPSASGGAFCFIETVNAPGAGPPRHRHSEAEIFRVLEGRYLYEMDGRRFYAEAGDVVSIPGGAEHGFVNVTTRPARQYILIAPALDAEASDLDKSASPITRSYEASGSKDACLAELPRIAIVERVVELLHHLVVSCRMPKDAAVLVDVEHDGHLIPALVPREFL